MKQRKVNPWVLAAVVIICVPLGYVGMGVINRLQEKEPPMKDSVKEPTMEDAVVSAVNMVEPKDTVTIEREDSVKENTVREEDTSKKDDIKKDTVKDNPKHQDNTVQEVQDIKPKTKTKNYPYGRYEGEFDGEGRPHGEGKIYFNTVHDIGESTIAEPGDVFEGSFYHGRPDNGILTRHNENGVAGEKIPVVIGH